VTLEALPGGRPISLADLLATHRRELQGVAYLILGDAAAAEDVVADTIVTAHEKAGSIRDRTALRAWLLRVATNRAISLRRRSRRVVQLAVVPDRTDGGDLAAEVANRVTLIAALAGLPPRTRAAVVLHYYADLTVDGVAAALGTSQNTVKTQLRTGLERLRAALAEPARIDREADHA
jgi:RNA polymerase sigma factor (sigma-70 family)